MQAPEMFFCLYFTSYFSILGLNLMYKYVAVTQRVISHSFLADSMPGQCWLTSTHH